MKTIEYFKDGKKGEITVDEAKVKFENVNLRCAVKLEEEKDELKVSTKSKTTVYKKVNGNWEV